MAKKSKKGPKSLFDKVNEIDPSFAEEVYAMRDDQLKEKLVTMAKHDTEIEEAKKNDTDLASIREQLKTANETYSAPTKANRLKRKLIFEVLAGRGRELPAPTPQV